MANGNGDNNGRSQLGLAFQIIIIIIIALAAWPIMMALWPAIFEVGVTGQSLMDHLAGLLRKARWNPQGAEFWQLLMIAGFIAFVWIRIKRKK